MGKRKIVFVSGNLNKVNEFKKILNDDFEVENIKLEINEIQSLDILEVCELKVKEAYAILKKPVCVEDTGFYIDELNGLPGPFIKFFEDKLGKGASIKLLGNAINRKAKQICAIGYFDGENLILEKAEVEGSISLDVKDGVGFGFDFCFIPKGYDKTFSEMGIDEKNKISARRKVIEKFKKSLERSV